MTVRTWRVTTLVAVAATGMVAGCGGDDAPKVDTGDPKAVVKAYLAAFADGDGTTACDQLAPAVQKRAAKLIAEPDSGDCRDTIGSLAKENSDRTKKLLRDARITKLTLKGTKATAATTASGTLRLTKTGGRWRISGGVFG